VRVEPYVGANPEDSCFTKKRIPDEKAAKKKVHKLRSRGIMFAYYPCYRCGGYHLTRRHR